MHSLISIIYVNFNTSELLTASISSLIKHSATVRFEIIIVDNNSREEEKKILKQVLNLAGAISIKWLPENRGFGAANNSGAAMAKGNYLFFLNPDTLIRNNVLRIFCDFFFNASVNIAACGGSLWNETANKNHSYGNFPGLRQEIFMVGFGLSLLFPRFYQRKVAIGSEIYSDEVATVDYIVGADFFIKTDIFKVIEGFDEEYFMYYEDADLCKRLNLAGYRAVILPQAEIVHLEGGAVKQQGGGFNIWKFEMLLKSKLRYYKIWEADKLLIIKAVLFLQIIAQFFKGNQGNSLPLLIRTYFNALRNS